jgi:hypothetical protein
MVASLAACGTNSLSPCGRGWGEGARRPRVIVGAEPPHLVLLPQGEKGRSVMLAILPLAAGDQEK